MTSGITRGGAYGENDVYYIAEDDMGAPRPPFCAAFEASAKYDLEEERERPTFLGTPTTEALIQIKGSCTMTQLDVRQPFGDYIQEGSIQTNSSTNQGDNQPGLTSIICLP
jgi:hypothetical protein